MMTSKKKIEKYPNEEVSRQYLFHGTARESVISILENNFDLKYCRSKKLGKGFYFSDLLDVSWRYSSTRGDSFSVLVCDTFYLKDKFEIYEDKIMANSIPENGVRFG